MDHTYRCPELEDERKSSGNDDDGISTDHPGYLDSGQHTAAENQASKGMASFPEDRNPSKGYNSRFEMDGVDTVEQEIQQAAAFDCSRIDTDENPLEDFQSNLAIGDAENIVIVPLTTAADESALVLREDNIASMASAPNSLFASMTATVAQEYCVTGYSNTEASANSPGMIQDYHHSMGKDQVSSMPIDVTHSTTLSVPVQFDRCIEHIGSDSIFNGAHKCGGCGLDFMTMCQLHAHLYLHGNKGSYHYDHMTRTAFPKYESVCCAMQTDECGFNELGGERNISGQIIQDSDCDSVASVPALEVDMGANTPSDQCEGMIDSNPIENVCRAANVNKIDSQDTTKYAIGQAALEGEDAMKCEEERHGSDEVEKVNNVSGICNAKEEFQAHATELETPNYNDGGCKSVDNATVPSEKRDTFDKNASGSSSSLKPSKVKSKKKMGISEAHMRRDIAENSKQNKSSRADKTIEDKGCHVKLDLQSEVKGKRATRNKKVTENGILNTAENKTFAAKSRKPVDYACFKCNIVFASEKFLTNHVRRHVGEYPCDVCFESFTDIDTFIGHICKDGYKMDKKILIYHCKYCSVRFSELDGMKAHVCQEEESGTNMLIKFKVYPGKEIQDGFFVDTQSTYFSPKQEDTEYFQCTICFAIFNDFSSKYSHDILHKFPHKCVNCCLYFSEEFDKNMHEALCTGNSVLQCKICKKSYKNKSSFTFHMKLHNGKRDYQCELCGQSFACMNYLSNHIRHQRCKINERERSFTCDACGKKFFDSNTLRGHVRVVHSDERKMVCEICGSTFKYGSALKKHKMLHQPARPNLECKTCGASFKAIECLKRHEKRHVQQCNLECDVCGKKFHERWNLKAHMRQHTGEKPYQCDICGKAFTHNVSRKNHMKNHHGITTSTNQPSLILVTS